MTYAVPNESVPTAEAQPYDSEVTLVVDASVVEDRPATATTTTTVYVIQRDIESTNPVDPYDERALSCVLVGVCFSWIPIIGLMTYCFNFTAPRGSLTYRYALLALLIALISSIFNIIFWSTAAGYVYI